MLTLTDRPRRLIRWTLLFAASMVLGADQTAMAATSIQLEVVRERGGPVAASHDWLRFLGKLSPDSLRIRAARPGDRPAIERLSGDSFRVTAVLTARNQLRVPGREFRFGDAVGLQAWIDNLPNQGQDGSDSDAPAAFKLSVAQLDQLVRDLSRTIGQPTKDRSPAEVIDQIGRSIKLRLTFDPRAQQSIARGQGVRDELSGLSAGTALAAVLRPLGLAIVPRPSGGRVVLHIQPTSRAAEIWPVGWPSQVPAIEAIPKLMEKLPVEIVDMPLTKVLAALRPRVGVPFLIDHNGLAAEGIQPADIKVAFNSKRTFYKRVLDRVLFQARLELEVRVDEANRPFLWIQPIRLADPD